MIGAAKCGTTSLHAYLAAHPELDMTSVKEPQVFASAEAQSEVHRYEGLLTGTGKQRGESSAVYSQYPRWPGIPARIAAQIPDARFIYLVRDPVERIVAHYAQHVADGKEGRSLGDALADWQRPDSIYVCPSRYATQLRQYLQFFDPSRFLVLDQDELLNRREEALARAFLFLAVDAAFVAPEFGRRLNARQARRASTSVGERLRRTGLYDAVRRMPLPAPIRRGARRVVSRPLQRYSLDPSLRESLTASLRDEVSWLRSFTGQGFASWSL